MLFLSHLHSYFTVSERDNKFSVSITFMQWTTFYAINRWIEIVMRHSGMHCVCVFAQIENIWVKISIFWWIFETQFVRVIMGFIKFPLATPQNNSCWTLAFHFRSLANDRCGERKEIWISNWPISMVISWSIGRWKER
jgi:hypothetical protein